MKFISALLLLFLAFNYSAQETTSGSNKESLELDEKQSFQRSEYRARISQDYLKKFTELSDILKLKEESLTDLSFRLEAVIDRSKEVSQKEQRDLFRENIRTLRITEDQLEEEIKLLKKGLRLLQENKTNPDPEKMMVLNEIAKIEEDILKLQRNSKSEKTDVVLEGVEIDDRNVYYDPPSKNCNVVFNGIDSQSDKPRKEIGKEFLFGYTHPKLKSFFKENHFLQCEVKLMELDKKKYLWLYITISSKDAIKSYGFIEKNSPMKFELLNGEILYAASSQNAQGRLEPYTGNTKYEVILPLDRSKYRQFSKGEIDKVGIMWSSGYEQYEVYNVDVVMNQIDCLENL